MQGDVKALRLAVEPIFNNLSKGDFDKHRVAWTKGEGAVKKLDGIRGALSKVGGLSGSWPFITHHVWCVLHDVCMFELSKEN